MRENEEFLNKEKFTNKGKILKKTPNEKRGNLKVIKSSVAFAYKILLLKFPRNLKFLKF